MADDCKNCSVYKTALRSLMRCYKRGELIESLYLERGVHWTAVDVEPVLDLCIKRDYDVIETINIVGARLPDSVGEKIATLIEKSASLKVCMLAKNMFSVKTVVAIAKALQKNTSVQELWLFGNHFCASSTPVETAFVGAVRLNPNRPKDSLWYFDSNRENATRTWRRIRNKALMK